MPERRGWWQGWRLRACSSLLEKQHFSEKLCWPSLCDIISGSCELNQIYKKLEEIAFKLLKSWPHLAELQNRDVCFCEFGLQWEQMVQVTIFHSSYQWEPLAIVVASFISRVTLLLEMLEAWRLSEKSKTENGHPANNTKMKWGFTDCANVLI